MALALSSTPTAVSFGFLEPCELERMSVKEISLPHGLDNLQRPIPGGMYDLALGPFENFQRCATCALNAKDCPGHLGHIKLTVPVYHPLLFPLLSKLLRQTCFSCYHLRISRFQKVLRKQSLLSHIRSQKLSWQVKKTVVKLLLLYTGQASRLDEVTELQLAQNTTKKKKGGRRATLVKVGAESFVDDEAEEDDEEEVEEKDDDEQGKRSTITSQHMQVHQTLESIHKDCRLTIDRSGYCVLSNQSLQQRAEVLREVWAAKSSKFCPNCKCPVVKLRKDGNLKLWVTLWGTKQRKQMEAEGTAVPEIMRTSQDIPEDQQESESALDEEEVGLPLVDMLDDDSGSEAEAEAPALEQENVQPDKSSALPVGQKKRQIPKSDKDRDDNVSSRLLLPNEVIRYVQRLWKAEAELMDLLYGVKPRGPVNVATQVWGRQDWNMFFLKIIPVSPSRFRPPAKLNGMVYDHPQNFYFKTILKSQEQLKEFSKEHHAFKQMDANEGEETVVDLSHQKFVETWLKIQNAVNQLMDSTKGTKKEGEAPQGIRQLLEKKEGLFRKNMMGKRVNFAARSVISPDPNIRTDEIGIPERFAKVLTYPCPVTAFNADQLRRAVINGPSKWPGANAVQDSAGNSINLQLRSHAARVALAKTLLSAESERKMRTAGGLCSIFNKHTRAGRERLVVGPTVKVVYRHLLDGDILLANRQPTLHKPSMMAHRVKVLRGKQYQTIRMHYANCKTYNADFDGDEINLHFPQNELARAEAYHIANNANQYVSCKDGGPLRGLIQDSIDAGILLTKKNLFLTLDEFQQLLYGAFGDSLGPDRLLPTPIPCILKPIPRWSGKQVITALLSVVTAGRAPLSMQCKTKVPPSVWGSKRDALDSILDESVVLIRQGELLSGVLDKNQIGASSKGLVHVCFELYAGKVAEDLLSYIARLLVNFLQGYGHTCGMDDLLLVPKADADRQKQLTNAIQAGIDATAQFSEAKSSSREDLKPALQAKLRLAGQDKRLDDAVKTAMNSVTSKVIDACLPDGQYKSFPGNCMSLMTLSGAKGSKVNFSQISALLGQQELEGRRVPLMASGKSLPSFGSYDPSPRAGGYVANRFLTGIRPQEYYFHCMAGREGLVDTAVKTATSGYLQRCLVKHLESLKVAYDYSVRDVDGAVVQFLYGDDAVDPARVPYLNDFTFLDHNQEAVAQRLQRDAVLPSLDRKQASKLWKQLEKEASSKRTSSSDKAGTKTTKEGEVLAKLNPGSNLGAVSDKFRQELLSYVKKRGGDKSDQRKFRFLMELNYLSCLCAPGEAVGVLTAQSIGEPSTQMTLNTFHLAGHGGANVTLGIPRLREIIMTASQNMKTPIMELPLHQGLSLSDAKSLSMKLDRVVLLDFLKHLAVEETLELESNKQRRLYKVTAKFVSLDGSMSKSSGLRWIDIQRCLEDDFMPRLDDEVRQTAKRLGISGPGAIGEPTCAELSAVAAALGPVVGSRIKLPRHRKPASELEGGELKEVARSKQGGLYDRDEVEDEIAAIGDDPEGDSEAEQDKNAAGLVSDRDGDGQKTFYNREYAKTIEYDSEDRCARVTVEVGLSFPKLLMMSMVERVCKKSLLRSTDKIKKSFVVPKTGPSGEQKYVVQTDGVNFEAGWTYAHMVDTANIKSNDIASILKYFGVEAARRAIVSEVQGVFGVYGIDVDPRHLGLLADYMTFFGDIRPLNRVGIENNSSPFQKISFETSIKFVLAACLHGDMDDLSSPSSELVMGKPVSGSGTGCFDLFQQLSLC